MTGNLSFDPLASALLVIDMQRDFLDPAGYAAQAGLDVSHLRTAIPAVQTLLAAARRAGMPVVHTREGHRTDLSDCWPEKLARSRAAGAEIGRRGPLGRLLVRGEYGHDFVDSLQPAPGELVVDKPGYSAFADTGLDAWLRERGIRTLVITGITTEVCVHSTLRAAIDLHYRCFTVADACASADPALHAACMKIIGVEGGIFGEAVGSSAVLTALESPCLSN